MNFEKLETLARTPRTIDDNLIKIHAKPFFFLKGAIRRWEEGLTKGPVVYGFVVQANSALFQPGEGATAPAVLLYTEDPRYCRNIEWLTDLGDRIAALRHSGTNDPDANMLGALLAAEESDFHRRVPHSLTGGVDARVYTTYISGYKLPNECVGEHRIVPLLIMGKDEAVVIPGELYA